jgi:hypothetical protein
MLMGLRCKQWLIEALNSWNAMVIHMKGKTTQLFSRASLTWPELTREQGTCLDKQQCVQCHVIAPARCALSRIPYSYHPIGALLMKWWNYWETNEWEELPKRRSYELGNKTLPLFDIASTGNERQGEQQKPASTRKAWKGLLMMTCQ